MISDTFAPGARVLIRDAEWLVRRVDRTSTGGQALRVIGISELVRNKEAMFLSEIDQSIEVLDPADTKLVQDASSSYQATILYIESLLRQTPPTDENLYIGHRAAMDVVPYQMDPAIQSLKQPRHRILIADAVGLGKTLEAGILLSELIRRGRGQRILVLAVKSMLTQFQKEMWSRFGIPLTRLDSIGIQRIRSRIPTNQNPFYYYDKAIISIDTLKQDREYRTYIENAYWDIIVIDEAQNVAQRGAGTSLRAKLAKLISKKSDSLIMLSATPHDGRARSFASLMNMLDATAIANPDNYGPEDIEGLFIRRFKKDIQNQVASAFKERKISVARAKASPSEEQAFDALVNLSFTKLTARDKTGRLLKTVLEKALFSSPSACLETIGNRVNRLRKLQDPSYEPDIESLEDLGQKVGGINHKEFSKYQRLLVALKDVGWTGKDAEDRLVIFTERIETLRFLKEHLTRDLRLDEKQVAVLYGTLSDVEQQDIVEDFGKDEAPVRLLIASDVASEGINLHYLCHRMIHFDIPWSLMVFQQRNGRIDRYGQERTPEILYLITESQNAKIRGDTRILEVLIKKDEQAVKNIGDPSALMGVYDIDQEEQKTAEAIEVGLSEDEFEEALEESTFDPLAILMGSAESPVGKEAASKTRFSPSLFKDDFAFSQAAIKFLRETMPLQVDFDQKKQLMTITAPDELRERFRSLPPEIWPDEGIFQLSADANSMQKEIKRCRKDEKAWPRIHYLWPLNPVIEWLNDKVLASFGRHEAPIMVLNDGFDRHEVSILMSGLIPNRKGHPLLHHWFGVIFRDGKFQRIEDLDVLISRIGLGKKTFPNKGQHVDPLPLKNLLPEAVSEAKKWMSLRRSSFQKGMNEKLDQYLTALANLQEKKYVQLELMFEGSLQHEKIIQTRKEKEKRDIDKDFDEYVEWVKDTMTTEDKPYIRVVAVLKGAD
jgi:superfamily II DNA/RNA helicase